MAGLCVARVPSGFWKDKYNVDTAALHKLPPDLCGRGCAVVELEYRRFARRKKKTPLPFRAMSPRELGATVCRLTPASGKRVTAHVGNRRETLHGCTKVYGEKGEMKRLLASCDRSAGEIPEFPT